MKVGSIYSGFLLKEEKYIDEVKSVARIFEHKKTGAKLLHLENDDDNKVFSIAFKTPPPDNTGISHILEHSILCGSRKYPTKEPFVELMKSSLKASSELFTKFPVDEIYSTIERIDLCDEIKLPLTISLSISFMKLFIVVTLVSMTRALVLNEYLE